MDPISAPFGNQSPQQTAALREAAIALEASFLAEMLAHTGLSTPSEDFGGGAGEEQFASFQRDIQARALAERGGIGLAEQIFRALSARAAEATP